jgi:hypothetical protein
MTYEYQHMTDSQLRSLIAGIRVSHVPKIPELDQSGGPNNLVCHGHGWGYRPPYPCQDVILCNELEIRLKEAEMEMTHYSEIGKEPTIIFNEVTNRYEYWDKGSRVYGVRTIRTMKKGEENSGSGNKQ